ncbi:VanY-A/VanY-F/VanY-M family D-Ala-D-Ala carboxypeptidase [Bacillus timonensis]|uniref:VanY-A/VanY-F/VanY-M family D-Ala-D-Ala carboxypeptidase n=1 Tax=Bacillus timonensis TaxID=1033734 RepID=UPI000289B2CE|nr:VanY-A/VanY-F/VanY-M family D-Ala-D-Ala carboxypeptidase [Bacillus timonensis]
MKKWGFLFLILLCLSLTIIFYEPLNEPKIEIEKEGQQAIVPVEGNRTSESIQSIEITEEQIFEGNLLLVNSDNPVQKESIKSDVINLSTQNELIDGFGLIDSGVDLSEEIARNFSRMVELAEKDGVSNFVITSGFRDFAEQSVLYQEMGSDYALPAGYSEHNLGLSLDIGSTQTKMAEAPEGKWIEENAWKYGFVLRYPKDKVEITGIQYEPWHIRYVGLPHSAIMKEKNFVLEEYLAYLKEVKHISATIDGEKYKISYYSLSENRTINIPNDQFVEISGNNMDGVIVTVQDMYSME